MNYPVQITFKILALSPQLSVRDADGTLFCYVKQRMFKLKEAITVFRDEAQQDPAFQIRADRIVDIGATYHFTTTDGTAVGSVKQKGLSSFWKARYDIFDEQDQPSFIMTEENPWTKVLDGLLGEIHIIGMATGYYLNPIYVITSSDGIPTFRIRKQRSFLESRFTIEKLADVEPTAEMRTLLAIIMMILLERRRG